ncbi:hypothetical protein NDU88_000640 [Pleurodeles waltl]|uniref:Secreted protein n=1 Tax=Pleurodeles waltl TaxID=8319 RepID=A0AAV7WK29_PLEWA|nr:hypothetical protein NDU88_000640 [Pleurodeles waltl]
MLLPFVACAGAQTCAAVNHAICAATQHPVPCALAAVQHPVLLPSTHFVLRARIQQPFLLYLDHACAMPKAILPILLPSALMPVLPCHRLVLLLIMLEFMMLYNSFSSLLLPSPY